LTQCQIDPPVDLTRGSMSSIAFSPTQPKRTDYNLRQRTHNLTLPTDGNPVMKKNFVYRMVFKDIY